MWLWITVSDQCKGCYCSNPEQILFGLEWRQWWFLIESSAIYIWLSGLASTDQHLKKYAPNSLQMSSGHIMQASHSTVTVVQWAWGAGLAELASSGRFLGAGEALWRPQTLHHGDYALGLWLSFLNSTTWDYIWVSFELKSSWLCLCSLPLQTFTDHFSSPMTSVLAPLISFPPATAGSAALPRRTGLSLESCITFLFYS